MPITHREKCLSHCPQYDIGGNFGEIGLEKEIHSFGESGEEYGAYAENNENEEKNGHQDIGCFFDTAVYPAHENDVVDQNEEDNPYKRFEWRGNESIEFC